MRKLLIALAATASLSTLTVAAYGQRHAAAAAHPQYGAFGFDAAGMDRGVAPGESFYRYANGNWDRTTQIPADQAITACSPCSTICRAAAPRTILEQAARTPGSRMGDFYASFMDVAAANAAGITPLQPILNEIKAVHDRAGWAAELGRLAHYGIRGPVGGQVNSDERHPDVEIVHLGQGGLGLPDREYYLSAEPALVSKRNAYQAYLAQLLTLAGEANAEARAAAVVQFERSLAEVQWTRVQNRDEDATYNRWERADFARLAPGFEWSAFFEAAGTGGQPTFLVAQPSAFTGSARAVGAAPQEVLNDYLMVRVVDRFAPYLSSNFVDANFAFRGHRPERHAAE